MCTGRTQRSAAPAGAHEPSGLQMRGAPVFNFFTRSAPPPSPYCGALISPSPGHCSNPAPSSSQTPQHCAMLQWSDSNAGRASDWRGWHLWLRAENGHDCHHKLKREFWPWPKNSSCSGATCAAALLSLGPAVLPDSERR